MNRRQDSLLAFLAITAMAVVFGVIIGATLMGEKVAEAITPPSYSPTEPLAE